MGHHRRFRHCWRLNVHYVERWSDENGGPASSIDRSAFDQESIDIINLVCPFLPHWDALAFCGHEGNVSRINDGKIARAARNETEHSHRVAKLAYINIEFI